MGLAAPETPAEKFYVAVWDEGFDHGWKECLEALENHRPPGFGIDDLATVFKFLHGFKEANKD